MVINFEEYLYINLKIYTFRKKLEILKIILTRINTILLSFYYQNIITFLDFTRLSVRNNSWEHQHLFSFYTIQLKIMLYFKIYHSIF